MDKAIKAYLAEIVARGLSRSSRESSEYALELLVVYLRERYSITDWREVTETHLLGFLRHLQQEHRTPQDKPLKAGTVHRWMVVVRCFFKWQHKRGRLLHNPGAQIKAPRVDSRLPRILSEVEIERLIEMPDTTTAIGLRDRALMELLYATGIRHMEAHRLDLYDVDLSTKRLTVRQGKGGRDRIVPLTENAVYWVSEYLKSARSELMLFHYKQVQASLVPTPALWLARTGKRLSYAMIEQRIKGYGREAEIKANVHIFRHCCATHLLRGGADIRHIQHLLGHSDLKATEIYLHVETTDLEKAVAKLEQTKRKR